jgi:hypothetical protein
VKSNKELILTFADSVAALIGISYGRYDLAFDKEDTKSREGSVMFFIVAFICTLVPLQVLSEVGRVEVLLISFLIGVLAAMIEAVSTNGNDNLLIPILVYSFVSYNIDKSVGHLMNNFYVMLFFLLIILIIYRIVEISKLSIAYALLASYVIMIQGGIIWTIPPLGLFITFGILPMLNEKEKNFVLTYQVIECKIIQDNEIIVSGDTVLKGYLDGIGDKENKIHEGDKIWHRTGDAGYIDEQGRLWLLGRVSQRIEDEHSVLYPFSVECILDIKFGIRGVVIQKDGKRVLVIDDKTVNEKDVIDELSGQRIIKVIRIKKIPMDKRHNVKVEYDKLLKILSRIGE